jgi:3-isopropylmalate/(R)-2-methylmalate dehydratase small subunit
MILRGRVWKFGDNIDTDVIIPVIYANLKDPLELRKHCMKGLLVDFYQKVNVGDIFVAGRNLGGGSARDAPSAIKSTGISCIIAKSFARIFYRNAFNCGLPILECVEASDQIAAGDEVEVNLDTGEIRDLTSMRCFQARPIPPFMQDLVRDGGLINRLKKKYAKAITSDSKEEDHA